jgi:hypothetical protein
MILGDLGQSTTESEQEQPQELIMEKETDLHGYLQKFKQLGAPGMKSEMV